MSSIKELKNKKIAILGLGLENLALVKYLIKHKVNAEITICDRRDKEQLGDAYRRLFRRLPAPRNDKLGKNYNKNLGKFDVLFRSPGWPVKSPQPPLIKGALTSPMRLFFELCPTKNIIGVTGTKGKGTTASLIYEILQAAGKRVWLGGNIGTAPFEFMDKIKKTDWVVLELSSFQLEDMAVSPHIAVITNFYPEHLAPADPNNPNFHKTVRDYWRAKMNIVRRQKKENWAILNSKFQITNPKQIQSPTGSGTKFQIKSKLVYFKKSNLPSKLIGEHNKKNIAAAVAAARIVGVKQAIIKKAVADFKGLEHRLELARELAGVKYYDDSFATTPEATITALKSFSAPVILLLGGADKGANFKELAKEVKKRCKFVVLLKGDATPRIKKELLAAGYENNQMKPASNIKDAVTAARGQADDGDAVLLSTACASFGMFKNYKERGELFKREVLDAGRPK